MECACLFFTVMFVVTIGIVVLNNHLFGQYAVVSIRKGYLEPKLEITTQHSLLVRGLNKRKPMEECPRNTKPKSQLLTPVYGWKVDRWKGNVNFIYSVEYDNRKILGRRPYIRIVALATDTPFLEAFCHIWVSGIKEPLIVEAVIDSQRESLNINKKHYHLYGLTCKFSPLIPVPSTLSINFYKSCRDYHNLFQIMKPNVSSYSIGLCSVFNPNSLSAVQFVEWMEYYRLIGVQHFSLYLTHDVPSNVLEAHLDDYVKTKVLNVVRLRAPLDYKIDIGKNEEMFKSIALSVCLLKNKDSYKFTLVVKTNEFFVLNPERPTVKQLMHFVSAFAYRESKPESFSFQTFVLPASFNHTRPSIIKGTRIFDHLLRSVYSIETTTAIISSQYCLHIHTTKCMYPGKVLNNTLVLSNKYASIYRYTNYTDDDKPCKSKRIESGEGNSRGIGKRSGKDTGVESGCMVEDETMLQFKDELNKRIGKQVYMFESVKEELKK